MSHRMFLASILALCLQSISWADQLSGWQTRGQGSNGELRSTPLTLPCSGTIVGVNCSGDGFWIESSNGSVQRFSRGDGNGTVLGTGTYRAYPNLLVGQNRADLSITIQLSSPSAPTTGTRGEDRRSSGASPR